MQFSVEMKKTSNITQFGSRKSLWLKRFFMTKTQNHILISIWKLENWIKTILHRIMFHCIFIQKVDSLQMLIRWNENPISFQVLGQFVKSKMKKRLKNFVETFQRDQDVLSYPYGIPNSLGETGQQWDFPNSWPPSVHMIIVGLLQSGGNEMIEGRNQAEKWLNVNYNAYKGISPRIISSVNGHVQWRSKRLKLDFLRNWTAQNPKSTGRRFALPPRPSF